MRYRVPPAWACRSCCANCAGLSPTTASRRLVVKVGSALLADEGGRLHRDWIEALATDIAALRRGGTEIMLVSSGAIAVGRRLLGLAKGPRNKALRLEESQAAAAAGQIRLAHAWQEALGRHDIPVAQILLTIDDTEDRRRYLNARNTMSTLLRLGVVPVINENDTVATDEIRFGDNDRLAARVAQMASADTLVLLSDIDGLYTADPGVDAAAAHIGEVSAITPEIEAMAGATLNDDGSGGMVTKIAAARIALQAGCRMAIANGKQPHALAQLAAGARCTWFISQGRFERGDPVVVRSAAGDEVARGLSAYSADDARRISGHRSNEIERILGFRGREEMIHRDDLVTS